MIHFRNKHFPNLLFLLIVSTLLFLGRQLDVGLSNYDDAYYAQKAKEMAASESIWVVPFNGDPAFDNPPLPFWLTAVAYKVFGVSGYAAVFFPALMGVGTVWLTFLLARKLFDNEFTAFLSAFVLLFPGFFLDSARRGMLDIPLAFFVTLAMFCFVKSFADKKYYLGFGSASALAVLTKSVLGFFPLLIAVTFLMLRKKWREIGNPYCLSGFSIALLAGSSWYLISWIKFGDAFLDFHFGYIIFGRGFSGAESLFYVLGYAEDFFKNYWPWLPVAILGLVLFGKRGFRENDEPSLMIFLWVVIVLTVMSAGKTQTLRYVLMIFPPLAIITSKTISDWLSEPVKEKVMPYLTGLLVVSVLFVNVTPFEVKVTLRQNSKDARELAPVITLNTTPGEIIGNYRLSDWNPRNSIYFYADRLIGASITDSTVLMARIEQSPGSTWLTSVPAFEELVTRFPENFYLIQASGQYVYFTLEQNRKNIRYDFLRNRRGVR